MQTISCHFPSIIEKLVVFVNFIISEIFLQVCPGGRVLLGFCAGMNKPRRAKNFPVFRDFLLLFSGNLFPYKTHKNVKKGHLYPCFLIKTHQNTQKSTLNHVEKQCVFLTKNQVFSTNNTENNRFANNGLAVHCSQNSKTGRNLGFFIVRNQSIYTLGVRLCIFIFVTSNK